MSTRTAGKRRFVTLDALRGLGALIVMAGHSGAAFGSFGPRHFYLAVDMFFLLSGFVIAHAYDSRFERGLTFRDFMRARIRRLYPVFLVGLVIGEACTFADNIHNMSNAQRAISFSLGLAALPSPPTDSWAALFPMNGPFWSLFFEFWVANLAYGLFWRQIRGRLLRGIIIVSGISLLAAVFYFRTMDIGWNWPTLPGGTARVCFSFFSGVLLCRLHGRSSGADYQISSWMVLGAAALVFCIPFHGALGILHDIAAVFLAFPAIVYFGASALEKHPRIGAALGDVSYAIYAIHRPLLIPAALLLHSLTEMRGRGVQTIAAQLVFMIAVTAFAWFIEATTQAKRKPREIPA
ncbi:MAG TPA: acyltransferase [Steroidobacteraceae bacterium]|jgi:peptidoglycan/LPS O-acetylase OafA/YrhL